MCIESDIVNVINSFEINTNVKKKTGPDEAGNTVTHTQCAAVTKAVQYLHINSELVALWVGGGSGVVFRILAAKDVNTSPQINKRPTETQQTHCWLMRLYNPAHFTLGKLGCALNRLLHHAG